MIDAGEHVARAGVALACLDTDSALRHGWDMARRAAKVAQDGAAK